MPALRRDVEELLVLAAVAGGLWILWRAWEEAHATEAAGALAMPVQGQGASSNQAPTDALAPVEVTPAAGLPFSPQAPPQSLSSDVLDAIVPQTISPAGRAFIKKQETLTLTPKPEASGGREIGWGHYIAPDDAWQGTISEEQAEELFDHDVSETEALINANVKVALSQNQFDALGSLAYNIPASLGPKSSLLAALNAGNYAKASQEILRWNKLHKAGQLVVSTGLVKRRKAEQDLFNRPDRAAATS